MQNTLKQALLAGTIIAGSLAMIASAQAGSCTAGANAGNCTINNNAPDNTALNMTLNNNVTATVDVSVPSFTGNVTGTNNTTIVQIDTGLTLGAAGTLDGVNIDIGTATGGFQSFTANAGSTIGGVSSLWDIFGGTSDSFAIGGGTVVTANRDGATDADQSEFVVGGSLAHFGATTISNFNEIYFRNSSGQLNLQQGTMNANVLGTNSFTTNVINGATLNLSEGLIVRNQAGVATSEFSVSNATVNITGTLDTTAYTADNMAITFATAGQSEAIANFENINLRSGANLTLSNTAGEIVNSGTEANFNIETGATVVNNSTEAASFLNTTGANVLIEDGGSYTAANRAFTNTASANLTVGEAAAGANATFNLGSGDFISQSGATVTLHEGADLTVGDASFLNGTTLNLVISNDATGTIAAGNAVDLDNATITATDGGNNTFAGNTSFLIADATSNQTITERVVGNVNGFDIRLVDGTFGSIGGDATQAYLIAFVAAISGAQGANNQQVQTILNTIIGTSDTQLSQIITNLQNAGSTSEYNQILQSILPTTDGGDMVGALQVVGQTLDITSDRLDVLTNEISKVMSARDAANVAPAAGGDASAINPGVRFWGQAFGRAADQGSRGGVAGFDAKTTGLAVGVDSENMIDNAIIGLAFSYSDTNVDSDNSNNTRTDISSYQLSAYGHYQLDDDTYLRGMAAYVYGDNDRRRENVGGINGLNANANFESHLVTLHGEVGRDYTLPDYTSATITPNINARYTHYQAEDFTETGAGGANLNVDHDNVNTLEIGAGVDAQWNIAQDNGAVFAPVVRAGIRVEALGDDLDASSTFTGGGAAFETEGLDQGRVTANIGTGFTYKTAQEWDFSVNYDLEKKADYHSHSAFVRATYRF